MPCCLPALAFSDLWHVAGSRKPLKHSQRYAHAPTDPASAGFLFGVASVLKQRLFVILANTLDWPYWPLSDRPEHGRALHKILTVVGARAWPLLDAAGAICCNTKKPLNR